MAPALELLARVAPEKPAIPTALPTPGTWSTSSVGLQDHGIGALQGGAVRQLHIDDQIALILCRDEARWHGGEPQIGQADQAAIDHEDDDAEPQYRARAAHSR